MRHRRSVSIGVVFLVIMFPSILSATPITLSDFSGSETLIDFNSGYSASGNTLAIDEVNFVNNISSWHNPANWGWYFDNIPGASLGIGLADMSSDTLITVDTGGVSFNRVGILLSTSLPNSWTLSAYAADNSFIESVTASMPAYGEAVFIGLESTTDIASVVISELGNGNGQITLFDDFRFESTTPVPEPTTILLLGAGLLGLAEVSRKRGFKV